MVWNLLSSWFIFTYHHLMQTILAFRFSFSILVLCICMYSGYDMLIASYWSSLSMRFFDRLTRDFLFALLMQNVIRFSLAKDGTGSSPATQPRTSNWAMHLIKYLHVKRERKSATFDILMLFMLYLGEIWHDTNWMESQFALKKNDHVV